MKNFLFSLLVLLYVNANGQTQFFPVTENGTVVYEEVVNCDLKKSALFSNAQKWIAKSFGDYKQVIQFEDIENGKLIFKGRSNVDYVQNTNKGGNPGGLHATVSEIINYTFTIDCRENKYRYTIDDILIDIYTSVILMGEVSKDVIPNNDPNKRYKQIVSSKTNIEALEKIRDSITNVNTSDFKKRDLKDHNLRLEKSREDIESERSSIVTNSNFYYSEVVTLDNLKLSIKSAMCVKDDF